MPRGNSNKELKERMKEEGNSKIRMNENSGSLHIVPKHPLQIIFLLKQSLFKMSM